MSPPRLDALLRAAATETAVTPEARARHAAWLGPLLDAHAGGHLPPDPLGDAAISLAPAHPPSAEDNEPVGEPGDPHSPSAAPSAGARVVPLRRSPRAWAWPAAAVGLAAAAALAVWAGRPPAVEPLDLPLASGSPEWRSPAGSLALAASGAGHLGGTTAAPRIAWESGRIEVEVDPAAQLDVQVETREGTVAVKGTVFAVTRDARGTAVEVSRGQVEVRCAAVGAEAPAPALSLGAGGAHTCWPTTPGGLLGRARALDDAKASPAEVLATLDAARGLSPQGPVADELGALHVHTLLRNGDARAAVDAALTHLDRATLRHDEVRAIGRASLVSLLPPGAPCDPSLRGAAARLGAAEAQQACGWPRE